MHAGWPHDPDAEQPALAKAEVTDEFTWRCLAIRVARKLKAIDVIDVLSDPFILRDVPGHTLCDHHHAGMVGERAAFLGMAVQDGRRSSASRTKVPDEVRQSIGWYELVERRLRQPAMVHAHERNVLSMIRVD